MSHQPFPNQDYYRNSMENQSKSDYYHQIPPKYEPPAYFTNFSQPPPNYCYPPPIIRSHESPASNFNVQTRMIDDNQKDSIWIKNWIQRLDTVQLKTAKSAMTISEARCLLKKSARCLQVLKTLQDEMKRNSENQSYPWEEKMKIAEKEKELLSSLTSKLESTDHLPKLLKQRANKRKAQERRKHQARVEKIQLKEQRLALHRQIDAWREARQDEVERAQREEDTRKEVDAVLGEVTRKKTEGRRCIALLSALTKLRKARAQAAAQKGLQPSTDEDERFKKVTDELRLLWENQQKEYEVEEQTLRVMMEEEAIEKETSRPEELNSLVQWERTLFGRSPDLSSPEFCLHNQAHQDPLALINIRRSWDQFVVAPGTAMTSTPPIGWVIPTKPSSEQWSSLLTPSTEPV